jgi:glycosyltransferase involved in cell wall biosynthesis
VSAVPVPSRPLRVLQLGNATGLYGAERWILALVRHLPADAVESIVGVVDDRPVPEPPAELCGEARRLGIATAVFHAPGRVSARALQPLRAFVRRHRIDVLHTHGYKTDVVGLLATAGTGCRQVTTPHGWTAGADRRLAFYEALDRACFPFMDAVAPLSTAMDADLRRRPRIRSRLALIPNGVDLHEIDALAASGRGPDAAPAAVAAVASPATGLHVGYVGRLVAGKRLDVLVDAWARLGDAGSRLTIVGEGPERAALEARARTLGIDASVRFLGYRDDRLALLGTFDAFVLPSESEGIPRCLMEALAAGVYCAASDIPGCRELVIDGTGGDLFPVGDAAALATLLARAAADPGRRRRAAAAGRDHVRANFSAARMARDYLALYRRILAS